MSEISREEFLRQKEESARRIREMYKGHNMPPYPEFVSVQREEPRRHLHDPPPETTILTEAEKSISERNKQLPRAVSAPLGQLSAVTLPKNKDTFLILGLILLLIADHADEKLIMALIFILL